MEITTCYHKNPSVVTTELDDGAILLNLDTKYYYNLNETGLRMWKELEADQNLFSIAKTIAKEYGTDEEKVKKSITRWVGELKKEGLVIEAYLTT